MVCMRIDFCFVDVGGNLFFLFCVVGDVFGGALFQKI